MIIVKYTTAQYEAKITLLEGYYNQLAEKKERLTELRDQLTTFWDDDNSPKVYQCLSTIIGNLNNIMVRANDVIVGTRALVQKLDGTNIEVGSMLGDALSALSSLM